MRSRLMRKAESIIWRMEFFCALDIVKVRSLKLLDRDITLKNMEHRIDI